MTGTRAAHSWRMPIIWATVAASLAIGQATAAWAASFSVSPTQVFLSAGATTALVTLKNETGDPIRFQLSVMSWGQEPDGQMRVDATEDVVVFPPLLTLKAHEERKVRVGVTVAPGAAEKTYRLFVEELPPLEQRDAPAGVAMRTKMGIPIFLQPTKVAAEAQLKDVSASGGRLFFRLLNSGTVHFTPEAVRVRALDGSGGVVFEQSLDSWYVLAGGMREFEFAAPGARCADVRSIVAEAQLPGKALKETLQTPDGVCVRQRP